MKTESPAPEVRIAAHGMAAIPARRCDVMRIALVITAITGCGCAIYLTLRQSGALSTVRWIPKPVAHWADEHGRARNFPAYFMLACPFLAFAPSVMARLWIVGAVGTFGTLLEAMQIFVPTRYVEWQDAAWSWAGVVAAWLGFEIARACYLRVRPLLPCRWRF